MDYDVPPDRATLEYQYLSDCFTWRWPDGNYMNISFEREFMYFARKLMYFIVLASV